MAWLQLFSTNENLSYIIAKNPSNPLVLRPVRKGQAMGWFNQVGHYCVVFKDPPQEMSYSNAEYEYLDTSALLSPYAYLNLLTEFFSSCMKNQHELDVYSQDNGEYDASHMHGLTIGYVKARERYLEHFNTHLSGKCVIKWDEESNGACRVHLVNEGTVHELLHLANLLLIFLAVTDTDTYVDVNDDVVAKYMNSLSVVKAPYYIVNLFKTHLLANPSRFNRFKGDLEAACTDRVELKSGNISDARKEFVESQLSFKRDIIDVGCGEGAYFYLAKKLPDNHCYFPVDRDEDVRHLVHRKLNRVPSKYSPGIMDPLSDVKEIFEIFPEKEFDIILSEVLEHSPWDEMQDTIMTILKFPGTKRLIITIPNVGFNQYYGLKEGEFRHADHKWEVDRNTFWRLLRDLRDVIKVETEKLYLISSQDIGDKVYLPTVSSEDTGYSLSPTQGYAIFIKDEYPGE